LLVARAMLGKAPMGVVVTSTTHDALREVTAGVWFIGRNGFDDELTPAPERLRVRPRSVGPRAAVFCYDSQQLYVGAECDVQAVLAVVKDMAAAEAEAETEAGADADLLAFDYRV
jgi:streptogramin lyase